MRRALVILSVVAAIAGEAPYHLPRPVQSFNYPPAPAPPAPAPPAYVHQHLAPAPQFPPQQQFTPNFGYNYQAPIQSPQYIQPAPQQPQGPVHSHPPPPPPPAQHHHHHHHHQVPAPVYNPSPAPLPFPVARPQPFPVPQPQPLPVIQPQPQPIYSQPSQSYGAPEAVAPRAPLQSAPTPNYALPVFAPQPAPQPFVQPQPQPQVYQPISYNQQQQQQPQQQQYSQQQYSQQQGYNYQQPQALAQYQPQAQQQYQPQAQPQFAQSTPVLSSYQADSHQYNTAQDQTHRDALDSLVVNRVQNIITDNEHSVARNAGYQSLVSGVSLGQAKPSVEITSFVHTSPLVTSSGGSSEGIGSSSSSVASSAASPSLDYGVPSAPAQDTSQSAESGASFNFLPQNKPAISYGPPN